MWRHPESWHILSCGKQLLPPSWTHLYHVSQFGSSRGCWPVYVSLILTGVANEHMHTPLSVRVALCIVLCYLQEVLESGQSLCKAPMPQALLRCQLALNY